MSRGEGIQRSARRWRGGALCLALCLAIEFSLCAPDHSLAAQECLESPVEAKAAEVVDARSLKLDDGRVLRLAGIEPFTLLVEDGSDPEAKLTGRLAALVAGAALDIEILAHPDRYGRFPALVTIGGRLIQETLAAEGLAIGFSGDDALPCFDRILAAEAEGRDARRGFWQQASVLEARPEALLSRIGRFVIFEGNVVSVGTRPATTYLDFGTRWSEDVTIEIAAKARKSFGGEAALESLAGSRIRARGFLAEKSGPMLAVTAAQQLEILASEHERGRIAP